MSHSVRSMDRNQHVRTMTTSPIPAPIEDIHIFTTSQAPVSEERAARLRHLGHQLQRGHCHARNADIHEPLVLSRRFREVKNTPAPGQTAFRTDHNEAAVCRQPLRSLFPSEGNMITFQMPKTCSTGNLFLPPLDCTIPPE